MKKILALVMALLVVMVCGVATAEQAAPKIGIAIYQFADNFMTLYRTELVRYLTEDCGIPAENITVMDGKNDQAEQTNQIDGFIADNVDVMILNPPSQQKLHQMHPLKPEIPLFLCPYKRTGSFLQYLLQNKSEDILFCQVSFPVYLP